MDTLNSKFEVEEGFESTHISQQLQQRLNTLQNVEKSTNAELEPRIVGEIIAVLATVLTVSKLVRQNLSEIRTIISELKLIVQEVDGLRGAVLQFGVEEVSLDDPDAINELFEDIIEEEAH